MNTNHTNASSTETVVVDETYSQSDYSNRNTSRNSIFTTQYLVTLIIITALMLSFFMGIMVGIKMDNVIWVSNLSASSGQPAIQTKQLPNQQKQEQSTQDKQENSTHQLSLTKLPPASCNLNDEGLIVYGHTRCGFTMNLLKVGKEVLKDKVCFRSILTGDTNYKEEYRKQYDRLSEKDIASTGGVPLAVYFYKGTPKCVWAGYLPADSLKKRLNDCRNLPSGTVRLFRQLGYIDTTTPTIISTIKETVEK